MGAESFACRGHGETAAQAFREAVEKARYDYGHAGYTGTIAEKDGFVMIAVPEGQNPMKYAEKLVEEGDDRIDDKWGPAGCVKLQDGEYLFFGWASS